MSAARKTRQSDPKIKALGWENLSPEALVTKTVERITHVTEEAKRLADTRSDEDGVPTRPNRTLRVVGT